MSETEADDYDAKAAYLEKIFADQDAEIARGKKRLRKPPTDVIMSLEAAVTLNHPQRSKNKDLIATSNRPSRIPARSQEGALAS